MQTAKCIISAEDGVLTVTLGGEIDHHGAAPLREEIDRSIFRGRADTVVFDLSNVTFMDSAGLGLILGRYTRISELGGRMVILNPNEGIDKILKLAGVRKLITVCKTEGEQI